MRLCSECEFYKDEFCELLKEEVREIPQWCPLEEDELFGEPDEEEFDKYEDEEEF